MEEGIIVRMMIARAGSFVWIKARQLSAVIQLAMRIYKMKLAKGFGSLAVVFMILHSFSSSPLVASSTSPWTWTCSPGQKICIKQQKHSTLANQSEAACRLKCLPENFLWPLPAEFTVAEEFSIFNPNNVVEFVKAPTKEVDVMFTDALDWQVEKLVKKRSKVEFSAVSTNIHVEITSNMTTPDVDMNEAYSLKIFKDGKNMLVVNIKAETYFGARHALETMFQLAQYDSFTNSFLISSEVVIQDEPFYPHRGVMLDTARNFIPVDKIKTAIDSMSYSKLNVFHWHITDSQSFPLRMNSLPGFVEFGAFSAEETYSQEEVLDIVKYAAQRGVRVLPELDAPAHVGAGWEAVDPSFLLCVNREPWVDWCVEPPCGQLNPASEGMYDVLETIYREFLAMFGTTQFHMGGDEIHVGCWNSSTEIGTWLDQKGKGRETKDFMYIWSHFLQESVKRVKKAGMTNPKLILWNNHMTKAEYIHHIDPAVFAIQIWTNSKDLNDLTIKTVAENDFKMIFSNYDATYLDCGFGGWVSDGNNWCSPYKEWQLQHQNDPLKMLEARNISNLDAAKANVLGGEVALWTEQVDGHSMMSRLEPRAAAYGEQLWRGPNTGSWIEAERRLVRHRVRLVDRGVGAETLTHGWCRQNEGKCILNEGLDTETNFK